MEPSDAFFSGIRYAIFGAHARGRAHGPVLIAALRRAGKQVVVVEDVERAVGGTQVVPTLAEAGHVDGAILLPPAPWNSAAAEFVRDAVSQCVAAGLPSLWIYTSGPCDQARGIAAEMWIECVASVCPCLYIQGAGFPHNFHRWLLQVTGQLYRS